MLASFSFSTDSHATGVRRWILPTRGQAMRIMTSLAVARHCAQRSTVRRGKCERPFHSSLPLWGSRTLQRRGLCLTTTAVSLVFCHISNLLRFWDMIRVFQIIASSPRMGGLAGGFAWFAPGRRAESRSSISTSGLRLALSWIGY